MNKFNAKIRLFCFPYAGGGTNIFRNWQSQFNQEIDIHPVSLPGREHRMQERPQSQIQNLVSQLMNELYPLMDRPYAFYGHSMGTIIAFELARRLRKEKQELPLHLFMAARGAPQLNGEYEILSSLPDEKFIRKVQRFNGLSQAILDQPELIAMITPILKADFSLLDNYIYFDDNPLTTSLSSYWGKQDSTVCENWVRAWQTQINGEYQHHVINGDHFFISSHENILIQLIHKKLDEYVDSMKASEFKIESL